MSSSPLRLVSAADGTRPLAIRIGDIVFKKASCPTEIAQVHHLNYKTFVREIGQHADPGVPQLIDKFHDKNLYLIAMHDEQLVGMLAVHDQPPFSVASRMPDPSWIEQNCPAPLEVRLLAVEPQYRKGLVLRGLLWSLYRLASAAGYTHLIASGVEQQLKLYRRIGFSELGPQQAAGTASFAPLAMSLQDMPRAMQEIAARMEGVAGLARLPDDSRLVSMLPGPVEFSPSVLAAIQRPPISHRDPRFVAEFEHARSQIASLVGASDVAILPGSGTLANECIAASLAALCGEPRGVVIANGEFGERLVAQARRWRLDCTALDFGWGATWQVDHIERELERLRPGDWVWAVHHETSIGMLNPIDRLLAIASERGIHVCLDCVSSMGAVPLDLGGVLLASSARGKCLGSVAGLAIVVGDAARLRATVTRDVPEYLDVVAAMETAGPRFTVASGVLAALSAALQEFDSPIARQRVYARYQRCAGVIRDGALRLGSRPLADGPFVGPVVTTFAPPMGYSAEHFALLCRAYGFEIGYRSAYLLKRGLVQIANMGNVVPEDRTRLFAALDRWRRSAG
ncbi:MAG: aminotransferase class V-fold PLP-dependent enzyme [Phycisphaerae bacterium]